MCVDQLVQKYIDALPSQYRSDVPIPSSNNVVYPARELGKGNIKQMA